MFGSFLLIPPSAFTLPPPLMVGGCREGAVRMALPFLYFPPLLSPLPPLSFPRSGVVSSSCPFFGPAVLTDIDGARAWFYCAARPSVLMIHPHTEVRPLT